jgi:hypothetical protein
VLCVTRVFILECHVPLPFPSSRSEIQGLSNPRLVAVYIEPRFSQSYAIHRKVGPPKWPLHYLHLHINLIINYSDCVILTRLIGLSSHVHRASLHMTSRWRSLPQLPYLFTSCDLWRHFPACLHPSTNTVVAVQFYVPSCRRFRNTRLLYRKILCDIFQQSLFLKYRWTKTEALRHCTAVDACCYVIEGLRNASTSNKPNAPLRRSFITNSKSYTSDWKQRVSLRDSVIRYGLWSLCSLDLKPCDFYLGDL